jgi:arylsulfatase A-like enzyme
VEQVIEALGSVGELHRTVIVFTSDNGYLAGEHRLAHGKASVYEPAIRVPLMIRGPGVPRAVTRRQLVGNVDLAPTILDLAGAAGGRPQDGRSLLPLARNPRLGLHRPLLFEVAKRTGMRTTAIRTDRWLYAEHAGGARELYDLWRDPHQLNSLHRDYELAGMQAALGRRLDVLRHCRGAGCRGPMRPPVVRYSARTE